MTDHSQNPDDDLTRFREALRFIGSAGYWGHSDVWRTGDTLLARWLDDPRPEDEDLLATAVSVLDGLVRDVEQATRHTRETYDEDAVG